MQAHVWFEGNFVLLLHGAALKNLVLKAVSGKSYFKVGIILYSFVDIKF